MSDPEIETLSFEDAMKELEATVGRLEHGDATLEQSIALYERGEAVHRALSERLDRAELRIEELRREGEPDPRDSGPSAG